MEVTVVGSGTAVPEGDRVCSGYFVSTGDHRILFDCGPGVPHHLARFDLPWGRLTRVFITHFHTDHIGGLPMLLFALKHGLREPRREPLQITGPAGLRHRIDRMADAFGDHLRDPGFPFTIREIEPDATVELEGGVRLRAAPTPHTEESVAYRLDTDRATLGYTGDTGPGGGVGEFLHGADLLIAECSLPDELAMDTHLTPTTVADLALAAEPERLLLTHVYPQLDRGEAPGLVRRAGWDGPIGIARDGLRITLPADAT